VARAAQITAATAATESHAPTDCTDHGSPNITHNAATRPILGCNDALPQLRDIQHREHRRRTRGGAGNPSSQT